MLYVTLSNPQNPEYGQASIPFPIPQKEYDNVINILGALELGDPVRRDCHIDSIDTPWPILKRLADAQINIDELDFLAKRLDSFTHLELIQYQAMVSKGNINRMTDLINMTYSCENVTVISDFTDLDAVGRQHYMNLHHGCVACNELEKLDGRQLAIRLIIGEYGDITPYGVVYENDFKMNRVYDGLNLPPFPYDKYELEVGMSSIHDPDKETTLYLPMPASQLQRIMGRSGIQSFEEIELRFLGSSFPVEVDAALNFERESIANLNEMSKAISALSDSDRTKLGAVILYAEPDYAFQIRTLATHLDLFEFVPGVKTPEEYGKYMIQESGHFEYDDNLEDVYDYSKYASRRMSEADGQFNVHGYVSYHGPLSLDELMMEDPNQSMEMQ